MPTSNAGQAADELRKAVTFYASFDDAVEADIAGGQKTPDTRFNHPTEPGRFVFEKGFDKSVFRQVPLLGRFGTSSAFVNDLEDACARRARSPSSIRVGSASADVGSAGR